MIEYNKKYLLVVYMPDTAYGEALMIQDDQPFLSIHKGDLINPRSWHPHWSSNLDKYQEESKYGIVLEVVKVEHQIQQSHREDERLTQHRIAVFTKAVDHLEETRLGFNPDEDEIDSTEPETITFLKITKE